jgi:hypothetical protein
VPILETGENSCKTGQHVRETIYSQAHIGTMLSQELGCQNERLSQQLAQPSQSPVSHLHGEPNQLMSFSIWVELSHPRRKTNLPASKQWEKIRCLLCCDGTRPRVSAMLCKAVVQTVLLYGSKTWCISGVVMLVLNRFHNQVACCITRRHIRPNPLKDKTWLYPSSTKTLQEAGLYPMTTYLIHQQAGISLSLGLVLQ